MPADPANLSQNPFAVLTFIAAPALLTNASSLLAMSTTNRMLRTREIMNDLVAKSERVEADDETTDLIAHVNRMEATAGLLLGALHSIYIALGAFAGATFVTLLGAVFAPFQDAPWFSVLALLGLVLVAIGVGSLILGSVRLFQATRISLSQIHEDARLIRARCEKILPTGRR